jgi:hypothetical protein
VSTGPLTPAGPPAPAGAWLDAAPVDAAWVPPTPPVPPAKPARIPPAVGYGIIALALVLVFLSIWGLGGLKQRTDTRRDVSPGTMVSTGPYELTFTEVTAQRNTNFDDTVYWKLTAIGSGRNTGSITIAPNVTGNHTMFLSKDDASQQVETPSGADFGTDRGYTSAFTPGLPPIPYSVSFKYPETYRPGPILRFSVSDLDFYDDSLLGDGDEAWHNTQYSNLYLLPVRVLPDATY